MLERFHADPQTVTDLLDLCLGCGVVLLVLGGVLSVGVYGSRLVFRTRWVRKEQLCVSVCSRRSTTFGRC
jgi:hypothetical protein